MASQNELAMKAIYDNDLNFLSVTKEINVNKICSNGMTLIGAAARTGNLTVLKSLLDYHNCKTSELHKYDYRNKPQCLDLDTGKCKEYKNIGYFVVRRDIEESDFGDGPTPEGMDALEWDMEVNETNFSADDSTDDGTINMYKWYANILNRTSIILESPDKDLGRLDRHGHSVLHYAVNSGNIEMVEYLLESLNRDLSINQNDACCFSPLHLAAANGDSVMVRWLLMRGANKNAIGGRHRQTPLHVAIQSGHTAVVQILIEAKADVNAVDVGDKSVLTIAVRRGNDEIVQMLVRNGARINHEEAVGVTPLRLAVWANNAPIVKTLVDNGARLVHSHHLLHAATSNNNLRMVKILVKAGAPLNVRDEQGYTPLMVACSRKNIPIIRYLLTYGADVNTSSHIDGRTVLHVCVQDVRGPSSVRELLGLLVHHGADMNANSYQGTVLFYAIVLGNVQAAEALVQHGADVNLRDERAYVDNLSLAKRYGEPRLVRLIVYGGFRLSEMSWDPRALRTELEDPSCDFLVYVKTNPLNLRELCRIAVRRQLGPTRLLARIQSLPLPTMLLKYLSLDIL